VSTLLTSSLLDEAQEPRLCVPQIDSIYKLLVAVSSPEHRIESPSLDGIDWDALLVQARHHSLMPLLAHRLLEEHELSIPPDVRALLKLEFHSNLLRNLGFLEEIKRILQAWREAGIEGIPYKGPVMAEQLWGSFALRECSDLDFLVRREDVDHAGEVLAEMDYRRVSPVADSLRSAFLRNASEEQFRHRQSNILLELQWAPAPRTLAVRYDEQRLWRKVERMDVANRHMNVPSVEDLVGLLVIHGWKHNWSKLIWLADLAVAIRRNPLDWETIHRGALQNGWSRILLLGLEMIRRIYRIETPPPVDDNVSSLAQKLEHNLRTYVENSYVDWHRDMLRARDSRGDQVRQVANFVFTPGLGEYTSAALPAWASPAYRAIRLARVFSLWPEKALE